MNNHHMREGCPYVGEHLQYRIRQIPTRYRGSAEDITTLLNDANMVAYPMNIEYDESEDSEESEGSISCGEDEWDEVQRLMMDHYSVHSDEDSEFI